MPGEGRCSSAGGRLGAQLQMHGVVKGRGVSISQAVYITLNNSTQHHRDLFPICSVYPPMLVLLCVIVPQEPES